MTNKQKINSLIHYTVTKESKLKNDKLVADEQFAHGNTHPATVLNCYKAYCRYEMFEEISKDIEKILFDF